MLGDSVMIQQCQQMKLTLAQLEDPPGMPCDISARVEAWPEGMNPAKECEFSGAAANVMCVDLSEAGAQDRQLNSLNRDHLTGGRDGAVARLALIRKMLLVGPAR